MCSGPGYEAVEETCDGFDNDCDGLVDEGCATCTVPIAAVKSALNSIWDIDFDYACNVYLTSLISGPDFTKVVPADGSATKTYFGNKNQNMGYGLVDPDPKSARVVVSYACGNSSCQAKNGLTLLYTCATGDPGCGCAGQSNCPGFLDTPFLDAPILKTAVTFNGFEVGTPTGLAVGAGRAYFAGNYRPIDCDATAACTLCDPAHPGVTCSPTQKPCCSAPPALGTLVRFTLPLTGVEPTFRTEAVFDGEQILGLSSGRDGSVYVGTYVSATKGNLYRVTPDGAAPSLLATFGGPVFSVTQMRANGDLYLEVRATPKLVRLGEFGAALPLTGTVPANPAEQGVLQAGPDGKLYRLIGKVDATSTLDVYVP